MFIEKATPHIKKLAAKNKAIKKQFFNEHSVYKNRVHATFNDPLEEEKYQAVKGLIHKYSGRVLVLLTMACAAHCRFCTRQRIVGGVKNGLLRRRDFKVMIKYVKAHPEICEVIFSGGDPLMVPETLIYALKCFSRLPQIKIIRISTRMLVSDPDGIPLKKLLPFFKKMKKPVYVLVHFEHPAEITSATKKVINKLREAGCILGSQTVFLKGVNDNYGVLYKLFSRLLELGVRPYNINHCDPVAGAERFICGIDKEIKIMTKLRKNLSGLAFPLHVIDAHNGVGKVPVPSDFWSFNGCQYRDFSGKKHTL